MREYMNYTQTIHIHFRSWVSDTDKVAAGLSQRVKAMTGLEVSRGVNGQPESSEAFQVEEMSFS